MLSFDVGSLEAARRFLNHVKLVLASPRASAVSKTLISLPAMMTHASMPKEVSGSRGYHRRPGPPFPSASRTLRTSIADLDQALLYV